jgi:hypothetical protein
MEFYVYVLFCALAIMAFLYSAVGHGGASGYLAVMSLMSYSSEFMRPTALILNIFVSLLSFIFYYRKGFFHFNLFWPFAIVSIPAAWLGGQIIVEKDLYKLILGLLLIIPIVRLLMGNNSKLFETRPISLPLAMLIGGVIGLLSGMIGIGGGILLSPVILMLHWADMKQTAAISALFIFVNSIAGLMGLFSKGLHIDNLQLMMLATAMIGGLAGSYLGAGKISSPVLKKVLAAVLLIAASKLLMEALLP